MLVTPPSDPVWIENDRDLRDMAQELARFSLIAVDTESNSLHAYQERVCLIQFSTGEKDYLVDPFAFKSLVALHDLFANPAIEKVFHAAEYDLICLKRDYGFTFENLFDTMLAARILGRPNLGLGSLIQEEFGIELDKRYQRADWGRRPLPPAQLAYARLDTFYLLPLRERLLVALQENGLLALACEDFQRMCRVNIPESVDLHETCWKAAANQELNPRQMAILFELCRYRDEAAKRANLPPFKVLDNHILAAIASTCPGTREEMDGIIHIPTKISQHGAGLWQAYQRGLANPPLRRTRSPRPDDSFLHRLELLRDWRKTTGKSQKVESDIILPREIMETIAKVNPKNLDEMAQLMAQLPYRLEHYGQQILKVLNGGDGHENPI
jgi:ribonuclease D